MNGINLEAYSLKCEPWQINHIASPFLASWLRLGFIPSSYQDILTAHSDELVTFEGLKNSNRFLNVCSNTKRICLKNANIQLFLDFVAFSVFRALLVYIVEDSDFCQSRLMLHCFVQDTLKFYYKFHVQLKDE